MNEIFANSPGNNIFLTLLFCSQVYINVNFNMKRYLLYLALFFSSICSAQNYNIIQWNTPHFFGGQNDIRAINVDSIDVIGTDSVFYNFFTIDELNPDSNGCINVFGPSWIGQRIIKRSDSLIIFLNYNNDSIFIHPLDGIGSSWTIYPGISATVTSIASTVINGSQDSIKNSWQTTKKK